MVALVAVLAVAPSKGSAACLLSTPQAHAIYGDELHAAPSSVDGAVGRSFLQPQDLPVDVKRLLVEDLRLVAYPAQSPPEIDGRIEPEWEEAMPLQVPLTWGIDGAVHAIDVDLRAKYDSDSLYLLAVWPEVEPEPTAHDLNKLTIHWQIQSGAVHCSVACHTTYINPDQQVRVVNAETIPQGGYEALPAAGGWRDGEWVIEWSRPLRSENPYDLQIGDFSAVYPLRVKVFVGRPGQPDPISRPVQLTFRQND
jgi:hypothetical protein